MNSILPGEIGEETPKPMLIEYFKFEIRPYIYATPRSTIKELVVDINVNGRDFHIMRNSTNDQYFPFESEIEHFLRIAGESLKDQLKRLHEELNPILVEDQEPSEPPYGLPGQ